MVMKDVQISFDETMLELFKSMVNTRDEFGLVRVNSVNLLKALLEEDNSVFYDCMSATTQVNPYKQLIEDCNSELEKCKEKEEPLCEDDEVNKIVLSISGEEQQEHLEFYITKNVSRVLSETYSGVMEATQILNGEVLEDEENTDKTLTISICSEDVFVTFLDVMPKNVQSILKNNGVNLEGMREEYALLTEMYEENNIQQVFENEAEEEIKIPHAISDFVKFISSKYKGVEKSEILGREKECQQIFRTLQKQGKKNVVLVGEPGVGKTSVAEKIAFDIANGNCPEELKKHVVLSLNVNAAISGTTLRGMAEERFQLLVKFLEKQDNVILFIDEIHMVIGAGSTKSEDKNDMANALKPFLASPKAKVIGATTLYEYELCFSKDPAFNRRFEKIEVKEPKSTEVYPMLKNAIEAHEKFHGVTISEEMAKYAILISSCFSHNTRNPDRTNDLIDSSMVIAKEQGKEEVDKDSILANFNINFELFDNSSDEDKKSTAYHEVGHYLAWRMSGRLKDQKAIAVSIMPTEDYLGITVFDDLSDEINIYPNRSYFIDKIAMNLAGRVAEEMYTQDISSGASADLKSANKIAKKIVCEYGLSSKDNNRVYLEDLTEKISNNIDNQVNEIIKEAYERAKQLLNDNKELLEKLVDALMENPILDEENLDRICEGK